MQTRIWLINIILLSVVAIASVNTYRIWTQPPRWQLENSIGKEQLSKPPRVVSTRLPAESSFSVVTERNLFNESRQANTVPTMTDARAANATESKTAALNAEETLVKINNHTVLLFGVVMTGDMKKALVTNPFQKGQERRTMWITSREMLDDYQVFAIEPKRVLLRKEGKTYQISMHENSKPRSPAMAAVIPPAEKPAVIHTGAPETDIEKTPKGKNASGPQPAADNAIMTPFGPMGGNKK